MNAAAQEAAGTNSLRIINPEEFVAFADRNQNHFLSTGRQALEALREASSLFVWFEEAKAMMRFVATWATNRPSVADLYIWPSGNKLKIGVVPAKGKYDFDLGDEATDLLSEIHARFAVGHVEFMQVPPNSRERFVPVEFL